MTFLCSIPLFDQLHGSPCLCFCGFYHFAFLKGSINVFLFINSESTVAMIDTVIEFLLIQVY